ncbi:MAG TPA: type VI secretion system protein TssA [Bryobacteraceae bacterium]|nr:type VI secretion system protein TssA [Bryobacteraceae bacterium]
MPSIDLDVLLKPIPGDNPSGADLRYHKLTEDIKEARRREENLDLGVWKREVKTADYDKVIKLSKEALTKHSKDLQIASWLTEAITATDGFHGLLDGLKLLHGLLDGYWDTLYPLIEEPGDEEFRAAHLNLVGTQFNLLLMDTPITEAGFTVAHYEQSRKVPTEAEAKSTSDKSTARQEAIDEGKVTPEEFEGALKETSPEFLTGLKAELESTIEFLATFNDYCNGKFGEYAPNFIPLRQTLEEIHRTAHVFFVKRTESGPAAPARPQRGAKPTVTPSAPSAPTPPPAPAEYDDDGEMLPVGGDDDGEIAPAGGGDDEEEDSGMMAPAAVVDEDSGEMLPVGGEEKEEEDSGMMLPVGGDEEEQEDEEEEDEDDGMMMPATTAASYKPGKIRNAEDAIQQIAAASHFLRTDNPASTVSYLVLRALRWAELRNDGAEPDPLTLSPPVTAQRVELKRLSLEGTPEELLEACERAIGEPCGRAWLDPQRLAIQALEQLGHIKAARSLRQELALLLSDYTELPESTLADDTPCANRDTRKWLKDEHIPGDGARTLPPPPPEQAPDAHQLALAAARAGRVEEAIRIMSREASQETSGRGRFLRKVQLAEICMSTGHEPVAYPILEDLAGEIEQRSLDGWESSDTITQPLALLYRCLDKLGGDADRKVALYSRICRLDPVRGMTLRKK